MCPSDTSPEVWKVFLELQRKMSPSEKLRQTLSFSESIRKLAEAGMRRRYPHAGEREIFLRMARQNLGRELFEKVYGNALTDDTGSTDRSA
jgi:hypothetical protein